VLLNASKVLSAWFEVPEFAGTVSQCSSTEKVTAAKNQPPARLIMIGVLEGGLDTLTLSYTVWCNAKSLR
jgi:hypothetical protein